MAQLSIPGYVGALLYSFQHENTKKGQDSPYPWTERQYGKNNHILRDSRNYQKIPVLCTINLLNHINGTQLPV